MLSTEQVTPTSPPPAAPQSSSANHNTVDIHDYRTHDIQSQHSSMVQELTTYDSGMFQPRLTSNNGMNSYQHPYQGYGTPTPVVPPHSSTVHPQYMSLDQFQYQSQVQNLTDVTWPYPTPSPATARSPEWYPGGNTYPVPGFALHGHTQQQIQNHAHAQLPQHQSNRPDASPDLAVGVTYPPSEDTSPSQPTQDGTSPNSRRPPYDWMKKQSYQTQISSDAESTGTQGFKITQKKTRTKDKYRIVYSEYQKIELEKEYLYSKYITIQRKAELSRSITLSERQVKIWFQNRRAKERKQKRKRDDVITPPDTPTKMPGVENMAAHMTEHLGSDPSMIHMSDPSQHHLVQHHMMAAVGGHIPPPPPVSLGALMTQTPAMSMLPAPPSHNLQMNPMTPSAMINSPAIKNELSMMQENMHCQSKMLRMPVH